MKNCSVNDAADETDDSFGFGDSVSGFKWQFNRYDERLALTLYQKFGVSEIASRIMAARNILPEYAQNYLNPTLRETLPDPFHLLDMDKAVAYIVTAVAEKRNIVVFGDYDVDGATSSALLKRFFRAVGVEVKIYIPDRVEEGYGPNSAAFMKLKEEGADLVITVDCGAVAFEPIQAAHEAGLDVVVIDHHLGAQQNPPAIAVVNPNRFDETSECKNLAAVGVCFLLCIALNKTLRDRNFYSENNLQEPNLLNLLDLVALGTVCDVVPLTSLNRTFVAQGLKVIRNRQNIGIKALCDMANLDTSPNEYHLGFVIGPRINAGGRIGKSDLGARLLCETSESEAANIAAQLELYNQQRRDIEQETLDEALKNIKDEGLEKTPVIFAVGHGWHPGVIGIIASRIKDKYNRPAAVITVNDGIGKASCRSIHGVNFGSVIAEAKMAGLLVDGGGHAMAGGFTALEKKMDDLYEFFCDKVRDDALTHGAAKILKFDTVAFPSGVNLKLAKDIAALGPYGAGNHKPKIVIKDAVIIKSEVMGSKGEHIRCVFAHKTFNGLEGRLNAVSFRSVNTPLGDALLSLKGKKVNVAGQVEINNWMDRENAQLIIDDVAV